MVSKRRTPLQSEASEGSGAPVSGGGRGGLQQGGGAGHHQAGRGDHPHGGRSGPQESQGQGGGGAGNHQAGRGDHPQAHLGGHCCSQMFGGGRLGLEIPSIPSPSSSTSLDSDPSEDSMQESVGETPYFGENEWPNRSLKELIHERPEVRYGGGLSPTEDNEVTSTVRPVMPPPPVARRGRWNTELHTRSRICRHNSLESTGNSIRPETCDSRYEREYEKKSEYTVLLADMREQTSLQPTYLNIVLMMKSLGTNRFWGGPDPFKADDWLQNLERNFNAIRCPEDYKKDVAVYYLEKDAIYWWLNHERNCGEGAPAWRNFRREFERKYFPREIRDRLEIEFLELTQGDRNVRAYEAEFRRLRRYVHYELDDEEAIIQKFLRGLKSEIRGQLNVVEFHSFNEMVERAVNVEEEIMAERREAPTQLSTHHLEWPRYRGATPIHQGTTHRGKGRTVKARITTLPMDSLPMCYNCGRRGHFSSACPNGGRYRPMIQSHIMCFTCGKKGHFATSCPHTHPTDRPNQAPQAPRSPQSQATECVYALGEKRAGPS